MLGEAQDVLLAAETSLARHHTNRRRSGRRPTEEAPHCLTCCCLDNRQVPCTQRCSNSSRRHSARRNTTVDELLRQMSFNTPILSDEETYTNVKNEVEDDNVGAKTPLACPPSRCASAAVAATVTRASSYCEVSKSPETTERSSCERWPPVELLDNASQIRSTKSDNIERSEGHSDGSKRKWPSDRKNSRRLQQLLGGGDRNSQLDEQPAKAAPATDGDEEESSSEVTIGDEAHIRELKLVRWQFIERIHDEVTKLHRLQRHLDGCCSPPPSLARRRSVSTMTSARLLTTEPDVSGQF